jgi:predicted nucleic acid-binding protein
MTFVVDASMAAAWLLADERSHETDAVLGRLGVDTARVPSLFWHEARSLLLKAERRGRIPAGGAGAHMLRLRRLPLDDRGAGTDATVFALAVKHGLSTYDATYLALARSENCPLATLDARLASTARLERVPVLGPLDV